MNKFQQCRICAPVAVMTQQNNNQKLSKCPCQVLNQNSGINYATGNKTLMFLSTIESDLFDFHCFFGCISYWLLEYNIIRRLIFPHSCKIILFPAMYYVRQNKTMIVFTDHYYQHVLMKGKSLTVYSTNGRVLVVTGHGRHSFSFSIYVLY